MPAKSHEHLVPPSLCLMVMQKREQTTISRFFFFFGKVAIILFTAHVHGNRADFDGQACVLTTGFEKQSSHNGVYLNSFRVIIGCYLIEQPTLAPMIDQY